MKVVYHGSPQGGLSVIAPVVSTHGERWVYACKDAVMAALFLSTTGGDLTCGVGREEGTGLPFVCERFAAALEHRYAGTRGSIYTLPADTFVEGQTGWEEEVVSPVAVRPIAELVVGDVMRHLEDLAGRGLLRIYRYPSRPPDVPADDEDLVLRGIVWAREKGEAVLDSFQRYHPHLVGRIQQGLAAGRCREGFPRHE
ncbi:TPA: hypothetical protein DCY67_02270 [Candidatus Acetothermia bacterium]|nr:hypothetical protein [Candidatus Acetothermia bacterium]